MLKIAFRIALLELLVHNVFHARVNCDSLIIVVNDGDSFLNIEVYAFMYKSLRVHIVSVNVESVTCLKCKSKSFIVFLQVVEHFRRD